MQAIRRLKVVSPASEKRTVAMPVRKPNAEYRSREHLTEREVERLIEAAKVAVVMGSAFGAPGFVRLSYATSMKNVEEGVRRMAEALPKLT